jgi:hypothetical protein
MKNAGKVSKRIWRMRGKYLSVYGEYGECRVVCSSKNRLRICGKNLCVFGEQAKNLSAYSLTTPREIKVCISQLKIIQILKFLVRPSSVNFCQHF